MTNEQATPPTETGAREDVELETWPDIKDDADAIVKCGERWKAVANILGCELSGFDDGRSATFFTPDGNSINVGPKFRQRIAALASSPTEQMLREARDAD